MKKIYITGSSSGIGKALAERALEAGHLVVGMARRKTIEHPNYKHVSIDLSDLDQYVSITFEGHQKVDGLVLVNNAGTLGDVKPVARLEPEKVAQAYSLNITAPTVLTSLFLEHTENSGLPRSVLSISSGAGSYPIQSWSTYCASKAALDMFSRVLKLDHPEVHCFSIAPGIVDTEMQGEIRRAPARDFPELQRFVDYKKNGELADPAEVAEKLYSVIKSPENFSEICFSLRDLEIQD